MNKILTLSIFLLFIIISCTKKDEKAIKQQQIENWNKSTQPKPKLLTFIFQPSLKENAEIVIVLTPYKLDDFFKEVCY